MAKIDFVPNDYLQQRQSNRTNFLYLVLLAAVMGGIGITFSIIKIRQKTVSNELSAINTKMVQAQARIIQMENLKTKSRTMMKSMLVTAELIEPVPKSVLLACITNNLPSGVSLSQLKLFTKEQIETVAKPAQQEQKSQYQTAVAAAATANAAKSAPPETRKIIDTCIELEGIAPSDIEVAGYIANLSGSILLDNIALVESKECRIEEVNFRAFKLTASMKRQAVLTKDDIAEIRRKREEVI